jgi:ATP-dependent Zn protease
MSWAASQRGTGIAGANDEREQTSSSRRGHKRTAILDAAAICMTDGKSKLLVAYHEIGHSVCA